MSAKYLSGIMRLISPQHLIAYCQANAAIQAAVGSMLRLEGFTGVPVLAEIKADNIAGLMPRRAVVITSSGGPEIVGPNDLARGPGWTCCATARTWPTLGR